MNNLELLTPDQTALQNVYKFCNLPNPYDVTTETNDLMLNAFKEIINWHCSKNSFYKQFLEDHKFNIQTLTSIKEFDKIPFIHANFFKMHEIPSISKENISLHLTSSGTTGQKSQMFFDAWSIKIARNMVDKVFNYFGFYKPDEEVNYLLYAYEPTQGFNVGTTNTNVFLTSYAKAKNIYFSLRNFGEGKHEFDFFGTVETLIKYQNEGLPVRIFGFPAFMYFTLLKMKELGYPKLKLHPDSFVAFGGGWKGHTDKAISKKELYSMIADQLGVVDTRIRESYGSVEHSIPYFECPNHNLHAPVWSKIFIRDVKTLEVLGYNKIGYLQFVTPYITSVPAISVLMGDLGELYPPETCGCGLSTPFFVIKGRAGILQNKSCAVSAAELLKK